MPFFCATASTSYTTASTTPLASSLAMISPYVTRPRPDTAFSAQFQTSLVHNSPSMLSEMRQGSLAREKKSPVLSTAGERGPITRSPRPRCFTAPGEGADAATYTTVEIASMPEALRISSALFTPFCRLSTTVEGEIYLANSFETDAVSVVFTQNST